MKNDRSKETVCITGGAGFIGSHVADAHLAAGRRVLIIDNLSGGKRENVPEGAELHVLDIRSEEAADLVRNAGVEILVHHAAQMDVRRSVEDPVFDAEVNILGSLNLAEAARRGGVRQIIFASTGGAIYGEQDYFPADENHPARPVSPYGVSKLSFERYLFYYFVTYGLNATCLRYANVYGERQNPHGEAGVVAIFLNRLLGGQAPTINGEGLQTRDYVHVSDVVRANLAAVGRPGFNIYNVGTGIETSVVDLYKEIARALGTDLQAQHGAAKQGEQQRSVVDGSLGRRELDLPQPIPLSEGLARTAAWFRERAERPVAAAAK
jgi:UDP-glucose 4-epimerase